MFRLLCESEKLGEPASPSHLAYEKIALGYLYLCDSLDAVGPLRELNNRVLELRDCSGRLLLVLDSSTLLLDIA